MNKDITFGEREMVLDFSRWAGLKKFSRAAIDVVALLSVFAIIILLMVAIH